MAIVLMAAGSGYAQDSSASSPLPAHAQGVRESGTAASLMQEEPLPGQDMTLEPSPPAAPQPPPPPYKMELGLPLRPKPILPPLSPEYLRPDGLATGRSIQVKSFRFTGNHVFSSVALRKVVSKYTGRTITSEELEQARLDLTAWYVNHGYISSGAVIEDQDPKNGIVIVHIVEGKLDEIRLSGNYWFRGYWLRHEMRLAAGTPLNFNHLKEGLQLLRQNPTISRINGELKPGGKPGESMLDLQVQDEQPFRFFIEANNQRPPSVGAELLNLHFQDLNVTGNNDPLDFEWGIAHTRGETIGQGIEYSGDKNYGGSYTVPFTPWDTTVCIHGDTSDSAIIQPTFEALKIDSTTTEYGLTIRQPLIERLNDEAAVSLTLEKRTNDTSLLNQPFSLSPGAVNGTMAVTVLRAAIEATDRSQVHVLSLRSTFSWGLNDWGATQNNGTERTGDFFSWIGQAQYIRRLFKTDWLLVTRADAQLTDDQLLALEQLSIGGYSSVRGYLENQILRDNGVLGSVEVRIPIIHGKGHSSILALAPFFDIGTGWDNVKRAAGSAGASTGGQTTVRQEQTLPSIGVGLLFTPFQNLDAEIYYGYALDHRLLDNGDNLQNYGLEFLVSWRVF